MRTRLNEDFLSAYKVDTPEWAKEFVKQFCNDKRLPIPDLYWYNGPVQNAVTNKATKEIAIIDGTEIDSKAILLHELTHYQIEEDATVLDFSDFLRFYDRWMRDGGHNTKFFLQLKENTGHYLPHLYNSIRAMEINNYGEVAERAFGP